MKIPKLLLALLSLTSAGLFTLHAQTLFPSNENGISVFGEAAQGNIDVSPTQTETTTTTTVTTHTTTVAAPTPIVNPSQPPQFRKNAKLATGGDPSVTKTYTHRKFKSVDLIQHNAGGGGIRVERFFTRNLGIALNGAFLGGWHYNTVVTGDLIFRYPFEFGEKTLATGYSKDGKEVKTARDGKDGKDGKTTVTGPTWGLAPYVIAGGGGQWDGRASGIGEVGGGVEFRFSQHYGFFVDGRYIIHDARQNYVAETAGFTYNF